MALAAVAVTKAFTEVAPMELGENVAREMTTLLTKVYLLGLWKGYVTGSMADKG